MAGICGSSFVGEVPEEEEAEEENDEEQEELTEERLLWWAPLVGLVLIPAEGVGLIWIKQEDSVESFCLLLGDKLASSKPILLAPRVLVCWQAPLLAPPFIENNFDKQKVVVAVAEFVGSSFIVLAIVGFGFG